MHRATCLALLGVVIGVLAACGHAPSTPLAPTAVLGAGAAQLETGAEVRWGAESSGRSLVTSESSEFPCLLGPFGVAEQSHYVMSSNGYEAIVCTTGPTDAVAPNRAEIQTGFNCVLPSGTVTTDSRLVITPSGHVTLTCQAK